MWQGDDLRRREQNAVMDRAAGFKQQTVEGTLELLISQDNKVHATTLLFNGLGPLLCLKVLFL